MGMTTMTLRFSGSGVAFVPGEYFPSGAGVGCGFVGPGTLGR
jgi:hypothetical protein